MKKKLFTLACAATTFAGVALADYPEKPVSFVVPWPPGDLEDVLTRIIANEFQDMYGVSTAVVNKPGGGGGPFPGSVEVATAPADGYTIGSFVSDVPISGPEVGIPELSPNPFEPIGIFMTYPFVIAASKDAPFSNWEELGAYAQDNDVALGHFGTFLPPTQVTIAAAVNSGFDFASEAAYDSLDCNTLKSGDVDVINTTLQTLLPCLDDVNVLLSVTDERISLTPDTPTVSEFHEELGLSLWNGLFVHKDVPAEAREKIAAAAQKALQSEEAQRMIEEVGVLIYWKDAEQSQAQIEADTATIGTIKELMGD